MIDISPEMVALVMFGCLIIGVILGHPVAFVMGGTAVMMAILGWGPKGSYLMMGRMFDTVTNNVLIAIPLFVLMASFLDKSGIAEDLFTAMMYLFGNFNGGLGLAVVILSVVFAATTGVLGATVVSMSLISMPIMLKRGYDKSLASGVVAAGGCLGILIPPSIMLVMMADQSGISVGRLFAGGVGPGVMLGGLYFVYIIIIAYRNKDKAPCLSQAERDSVTTAQVIKMLVVSLVPPMILIIGVLGSIWFGVATPTEAAGVGAFMAFLLMLVYRRFTWDSFKNCVYSASRTNAMVMATLLGATVFTGVFLGLGGGRVVTDMVLSFSTFGKWGVFSIMMLIVFFLGFFIDWIGIILITFPIFLPIAAGFGFDPVWFIIAMAVNLQMSFLTPPFGYALFYLKGTVPEGVSLRHIYKGVFPFIIIQVAGLILITIFPQIATFLPSLFLK
jgi:tripartite ATP-independent transporter DctM subunit